jgi:hypothetical protein
MDLISELLKPDRSSFDAAAMARGIPGLPTGFTWRERHYAIAELLESWKQSEPCDHHSGERYYRKHFYRFRVDTGEVWTVYALRHVKRGENPRNRWWLYTVEPVDQSAARNGSSRDRPKRTG